MKVQVFANSGQGFVATGQCVDITKAQLSAQPHGPARDAWVTEHVTAALSAWAAGRTISRVTLTKVGAKTILEQTHNAGTVGIYVTVATPKTEKVAPVKVAATKVAATKAPAVRTLKSDLIGAQKANVTRIQHATGKSAAEVIAFLGY